MENTDLAYEQPFCLAAFFPGLLHISISDGSSWDTVFSLNSGEKGPSVQS
ncbi:hypothetical protein TREAZ_0393 [Leadbettera azotonutricia ZAS-9]|uniref:Uncharacterized protein n=1 Tax=Leadbettera azotonutricia (strain ATCC BAA-888 / DSM 13862 / ZAS-9) TaxID=545695 RepID=F5YCX9_LEAAZ|nr:hypothetical protein TREAZ_0393 [Leadbettera azotonutricia ZAS-9]